MTKDAIVIKPCPTGMERSLTWTFPSPLLPIHVSNAANRNVDLRRKNKDKTGRKVKNDKNHSYYSPRLFVLFSLVLKPSAGYGLLVHEVS
jgi:hypothetical protein